MTATTILPLRLLPAYPRGTTVVIQILLNVIFRAVLAAFAGLFASILLLAISHEIVEPSPCSQFSHPS